MSRTRRTRIFLHFFFFLIFRCYYCRLAADILPVNPTGNNCIQILFAYRLHIFRALFPQFFFFFFAVNNCVRFSCTTGWFCLYSNNPLFFLFPAFESYVQCMSADMWNFDATRPPALKTFDRNVIIYHNVSSGARFSSRRHLFVR